MLSFFLCFILRVFYFNYLILFWLQYSFCCSHGVIITKGQTTERSLIYLHWNPHSPKTQKSSVRPFRYFWLNLIIFRHAEMPLSPGNELSVFGNLNFRAEGLDWLGNNQLLPRGFEEELIQLDSRQAGFRRTYTDSSGVNLSKVSLDHSYFKKR